MRKERKHYTAEEKVAILRRHLLDKVPVSDLCEELGLQPTVFYRWQKEFFENGAAAFQTTERPRRQAGEDFWLELWEKEAIIGFHRKNPWESLSATDVHDAGCRRGGGQMSLKDHLLL